MELTRTYNLTDTPHPDPNYVSQTVHTTKPTSPPPPPHTHTYKLTDTQNTDKLTATLNTEEYTQHYGTDSHTQLNWHLPPWPQLCLTNSTSA